MGRPSALRACENPPRPSATGTPPHTRHFAHPPAITETQRTAGSHTTPMEPFPTPQVHESRLVRTLLYAVGVLALLLAVLGAILPGLPTTPFVIAAAACFVRASPRAHAWLQRTKLFGPLLQDWERHHAISRRVRRVALGMMAFSGAVSIAFLHQRPGLQLAVLAGVTIGCLTLLRIRVRD